MLLERSRARGFWIGAALSALACTTTLTQAEQADTASPGVAQSTPREPDVEEVVVTGSRIARPDYAATSPILSVSSDVIAKTGQVDIENALNQLPQFVP